MYVCKYMIIFCNRKIYLTSLFLYRVIFSDKFYFSFIYIRFINILPIESSIEAKINCYSRI